MSTSKGFKIKKIWAFIAEEEDGTEGVCGYEVSEGKWMPLIGADGARLESLLPIAKQIAIHTNRRMELREFSTMVTTKVIEPK